MTGKKTYWSSLTQSDSDSSPEADRCLLIGFFSVPKPSVSMSKLNFLLLLIFFLLLLSHDSYGARRPKKLRGKATTCKAQLTEWTDCSKSCDMGISVRRKNTPKCRVKREKRLCNIRPCDIARFRSKSKKSCLPMFKQKQYLFYAEARSLKKYKMRYCGVCRNASKCCTPYRVKTRTVKFRTEGGKFFKRKVGFIKKCRCRRSATGSCPGISTSSVAINLEHDTSRPRKKNKKKQKNNNVL